MVAVGGLILEILEGTTKDGRVKLVRVGKL